MARKAPRLRLVDTTFRDAQQSLLGGQLRGDEIVPIAAKMDAIGFTAMEAFGGATFETQVRRREDPWEYLRNLSKVTPNTPIQALVRGQNLLANRNFPDDVVELFVKHAAKCGVDVFRIFDPLNDLRNMEATVAAALKAKKKVQGALSYAISPAHNIELWCSLAKGLVNMGCHEVVIKDTSGLLSPQATWELVTALKETVQVPIDIHSHCSSGMAPMAYMAGVEAGATILDVAMSPLAWGTSPPGGGHAAVTPELKDSRRGLYGRPPVPAGPELRRLVLGREEPITIRPADLLEPQVGLARQQIRKLGYEPTDDNVLIHLMSPGLAQDYFRGPERKASEGSKPEPVAAPAGPAPPLSPEVAEPADPPPPAVSTAEFEVEVEGEVFKVRVTGAGMTVTPGAGGPSGPSTAAPPAKTGEG